MAWGVTVVLGSSVCHSSWKGDHMNYHENVTAQDDICWGDMLICTDRHTCILSQTEIIFHFLMTLPTHLPFIYIIPKGKTGLTQGGSQLTRLGLGWAVWVPSLVGLKGGN